MPFPPPPARRTLSSPAHPQPDHHAANITSWLQPDVPDEACARPSASRAELEVLGARWASPHAAHHQGGPISGDRRIAVLPDRQWRWRPEHCRAGVMETLTLLDGQVLLCAGCGIDAT